MGNSAFILVVYVMIVQHYRQGKMIRDARPCFINI